MRLNSCLIILQNVQAARENTTEITITVWMILRLSGRNAKGCITRIKLYIGLGSAFRIHSYSVLRQSQALFVD